MLFIEKGDRGSEVQFAPQHGSTPPHAVQSVAVAHQNAQRTFRSGSRNMNGNLANNALAAVRPDYGFNRNLIPGPRFSDVGTGALQACPAAITHDFKIELHAAYIGLIVRIIVNSAEPVSQRHR